MAGGIFEKKNKLFLFFILTMMASNDSDYKPMLKFFYKNMYKLIKTHYKLWLYSSDNLDKIWPDLAGKKFF